ncbi:MAG: MBL fold metallo-hydrolase [Tepidanaerobacteraceae bacterium]|nr:MBL fold metallo-hydrolase [Tepidanaerobacteraceae bacterium]
MMEQPKIVRSDGRGILAGDYLNENRDITREQWLEDSFPEWGTFLNQQIEAFKVPAGQVCLWWLGGPSWVLKTDEGGIFFIDVYSGPSMYTSYYYCGVCKQAGAESLDWLRLNVQLIDPWKFNRLDGVFCTHKHQDHCDIYTVKATLKTTNCKFYGPPDTADKLRRWEVPENRLVVARVGESVKIPGAEVEFLINYDETVVRTGSSDEVAPYEQMAVSYLFKTSGGNILFLGDTWYHNGYRAVGECRDIDVAIFDMGANAPGATDKMNPYDCARLGQALNAKVLIPDHYDNWANTASDPELLVNQFERIVAENTPEIKTVILRAGARFLYPQDKNIKRYRYPDWRERYNIECSKLYGEQAKALREKK